MKLNKWREIPEDKKGHIITGMMIGAVTTGLVSRSFDLTYAFIASMIVVTIIGLLKETRDSTGKGDPDWMDVVATIAGGSYGIFIVMLLIKLFNI